MITRAQTKLTASVFDQEIAIDSSSGGSINRAFSESASRPCRFRRRSRAGAREPSKYSALHEPRSTRVIMIKGTAGDFARCKKPLDNIAAGIQDLGLVGNADAAEGKRDATHHREGVIG